MTFSQLAIYFEKLENIASRNEMTKLLAQLFAKSSINDIGNICYLLQGRIAPLFTPLEFNVADKMIAKAISNGTNVDLNKINLLFKQTGDMGISVEKIKKQKLNIPASPAGRKNTYQKLNINQVYNELLNLAKLSGEGSQENKINLLGNLIKNVDPKSARYIVRIVLAKLRLGFSDMTILDALSWMITQSKQHKDILENAYNVRPDLGFIAYTAKKAGIKGLEKISPFPGTPIRMAKADRLTSSEDIFAKIGKCAVEYKYDGLRLQVHYHKNKTINIKTANSSVQQKLIVDGVENEHIRLFSRNLEDVTRMFPDVCESINKQIKAESVIFEGEIVAYNPKTGASVPFQETMQRKRKYDIAAKSLEVPVKLYAFELLYCDSQNYINQSYKTRKDKLKNIIKDGKTIIYAQEKIATDAQIIDSMFEESIKLNFEGIIAKKLDGVYEAGMRGWNWIKFKKSMNKKLSDTIDVLVMGITKGEGKRTTFGVGQFLTGVYDMNQDKYVTLTKIGTGLTDEQFREFAKKVEKLKITDMPKNYEVDKLLLPDTWIKPGLVVEISGDIITRSSVHTAGRVMQKTKTGGAWEVKESGFALRFPRLERFRSDKNPQDTTTLKEIKQMFFKQK